MTQTDKEKLEAIDRLVNDLRIMNKYQKIPTYRVETLVNEFNTKLGFFRDDDENDKEKLERIEHLANNVLYVVPRGFSNPLNDKLSKDVLKIL